MSQVLTRPVCTLFAFTALAAASANACAQNIVRDPGFENAVAGTHIAGRTSNGLLADFGDGAWTATLNNPNVTTGAAHSDSHAVDNVGDDPISFQQTLVTTPGLFYTLSFYAASTTSFQTSLSGMFGGTPFSVPGGVSNGLPPPGNNFTLGPYQQFTFAGLGAPTGSTTLSFTIYAPLAGILVDDISVTPTPEPGALAALLASGVMGAGLFLKRRRVRARFARSRH